MKFFVPGTKDEKEAENVYSILRKNMVKKGYQPNDSRIYEIEFDDNGMRLTETVGKPSSSAGESVVAIFNSGDLYLICTTNRGVLRGLPMLAGEWAIVRVETFESETSSVL
ncbi:hypothetical protein [Larkinella soli]|uniref:hypothetical protein n=1 Tax=Larkinella soli TaxID=1770527 RepID=UPI000FFB7397|nr:hypothetical protein [Larkinella soli]